MPHSPQPQTNGSEGKLSLTYAYLIVLRENFDIPQPMKPFTAMHATEPMAAAGEYIWANSLGGAQINTLIWLERHLRLPYPHCEGSASPRGGGDEIAISFRIPIAVTYLPRSSQAPSCDYIARVIEKSRNHNAKHPLANEPCGGCSHLQT